MIYVDSSDELLDLIKTWTPNSVGVEIGGDSKTVLEKLQANVKCILIYPWHYISRNSDGSFTPESSEFIRGVNQGLQNGICTIFGGNGEISIFGEKSIITDTPNRKKYLDIIHSTEKKD